MKYFLVTVAVLAASVLTVAGIAAAQEVVEPLPEAHANHIKARCGDVLTTLRRIKESDGVTYTNRYQLYYSVSDKLMLRLNSRLALNRLDGGSLLGVTADYEVARTHFQDSYRQYEEHMSRLLKADCRKQPTEFYRDVIKARQLRSEVHAAVAELNNYIRAYAEAFDSFRVDFNSTNKAQKETT